jgi:thiamine monophosphate synthase
MLLTYARESIGLEAILGVAVVTLEKARAVTSENADFLLLNLDWSDPDLSLGMFREYINEVSVPIVAGTDMPIEMARKCMTLGAAGVAVCRTVMSEYNRTAAVRAYAEAIGIRTNG